MNNLLLKTSRQRAQSRLYESSCLAHRIITIHEQSLVKAISECDTLDGLTALTDNLENLVRNPSELLVQFPLLSSRLLAAPSASTTVVTSDDVNLPGEDDSIYEFMSLYDSEEVVDYRNMKDATDTILDELVEANAYSDDEVSQTPNVCEPEQSHPRPHLSVLETDMELTESYYEPHDVTTDLLMKGFLVSDTSLTKRKNKSPRNCDESRKSPGKSDGEKKRGRPSVSPCDRKYKVKKDKAKVSKKVVDEANDCVVVVVN